VAVNEREREPGERQEKRRIGGKKRRKKNQEHKWGGAAATEAIVEVFGSAIGDCNAK